MPIRDLIPWKKSETEELSERTPEYSDPILELQSRMNRMLDSFFEEPIANLAAHSPRSNYLPSIDFSETEKEFTLSADLPGMEEKDIEISLSKNILTIRGNREEVKEEEGRQYHRIERSSGSFYREIQLPEGIDEEMVEAKFKNGVLTIHLPKSESAVIKHKKIPIKTGK